MLVNHVKVGRDRAGRHPAAAHVCEVPGADRFLMIDANQVWDVPGVIDWLHDLAFAKPWFMREPTSPDDVEGHLAIRCKAVLPMKVATGEMCQNRILFKRFISVRRHRRGADRRQLPPRRRQQILAVMRWPPNTACPSAPIPGGVGRCASTCNTLSMIDLCIAGTRQNRVINYVDHLHEHFVDPCVVKAPPHTAHRARLLDHDEARVRALHLQRLITMDLGLQGRVIRHRRRLSGIGAAICRQLAARGRHRHQHRRRQHGAWRPAPTSSWSCKTSPPAAPPYSHRRRVRATSTASSTTRASTTTSALMPARRVPSVPRGGQSHPRLPAGSTCEPYSKLARRHRQHRLKDHRLGRRTSGWRRPKGAPSP